VLTQPDAGLFADASDTSRGLTALSTAA
jgi:hypothetical protein